MIYQELKFLFYCVKKPNVKACNQNLLLQKRLVKNNIL